LPLSFLALNGELSPDAKMTLLVSPDAKKALPGLIIGDYDPTKKPPLGLNYRFTIEPTLSGCIFPLSAFCSNLCFRLVDYEFGKIFLAKFSLLFFSEFIPNSSNFPYLDKTRFVSTLLIS
jgi:hypothetical protein